MHIQVCRASQRDDIALGDAPHNISQCCYGFSGLSFRRIARYRDAIAPPAM